MMIVYFGWVTVGGHFLWVGGRGWTFFMRGWVWLKVYFGWIGVSGGGYSF